MENNFYKQKLNKFFDSINMENEDIRWKQRFSNYTKALEQLKEFIEKGDELNKHEKQGMIKAFEYTYELAWNTIKDYYE